MELSFFDRLSSMIVVDLGTVNTLIAGVNKGIVLREPSRVVVNTETGEILALGSENAKNKPQTLNGVRTVFPMRDGVVVDITLMSHMVAGFVKKAFGNKFRPFGMTAVICVPGCVTSVEQQAIEEAFYRAGIKKVFVMSEAVAAAIGAGLPVYKEDGCMIVDIGGGTTDTAIMSKNGVEAMKSHKHGSVHMNEAIIRAIKMEYGIDIGDATAEELKCSIGLVGTSAPLAVRGRRINTGLPDTVEVDTGVVASTLQRETQNTVSLILDTLLESPPELVSKVIERGIMLSGGGALLKGIVDYISSAAGVDVLVAEDSLDCVLLGAMQMADELIYGPVLDEEDSGFSAITV